MFSSFQVNLSHEAFDDLMVSAGARIARLRAVKAAADAFANGLSVDCRAPLEAAAAACDELRHQGPLPESLELSAAAATARIVAMSVAQAKKRAEYEAALVAAMEGDEWEPARDALAQATEGKATTKIIFKMSNIANDSLLVHLAFYRLIRHAKRTLGARHDTFGLSMPMPFLCFF